MKSVIGTRPVYPILGIINLYGINFSRGFHDCSATANPDKVQYSANIDLILDSIRVEDGIEIIA